MAFVEGFYTFQLEVSHPLEGLYERIRIKTPRHPEESAQYLAARVLAYCHCYREGQEFTQGLFEERQPAIWHKDILDQVLLWVDIGCPGEKKLKRALRESAEEYRVYFFTDEQRLRCCQYLRGSRTNWISGIRFFQLPEERIDELAEGLELKNEWSVTFMDQVAYVAANDRQHELEIRELDLWHEFQISIASPAP